MLDGYSIVFRTQDGVSSGLHRRPRTDWCCSTGKLRLPEEKTTLSCEAGGTSIYRAPSTNPSLPLHICSPDITLKIICKEMRNFRKGGGVDSPALSQVDRQQQEELTEITSRKSSSSFYLDCIMLCKKLKKLATISSIVTDILSITDQKFSFTRKRKTSHTQSSKKILWI